MEEEGIDPDGKSPLQLENGERQRTIGKVKKLGNPDPTHHNTSGCTKFGLKALPPPPPNLLLEAVAEAMQLYKVQVVYSE
jgi:hypothetical protein